MGAGISRADSDVDIVVVTRHKTACVETDDLFEFFIRFLRFEGRIYKPLTRTRGRDEG